MEENKSWKMVKYKKGGYLDIVKIRAQLSSNPEPKQKLNMDCHSKIYNLKYILLGSSYFDE